MVKTKGAVDLKGRRKKRKDRGHKRKFYAGKKVKRKRKNRVGNFVEYKPTRKRNDPILIWFWHKTKMSPEGYRRFPSHMRQWIKPIILMFVDKPFYVNPDDISTKEKLGLVAVDKIQYSGSFILTMPSHSKNSYRASFKKKADIKILEDPDGNLYCRVMNCGALRRYWFFKD